MRLELVPISVQDANHLVAEHHSHHGPTVSGLWATAVAAGEEIVGAAIVGRPSARLLDDGWTVEVTRCVVVHADGCARRRHTWRPGDDYVPTGAGEECDCRAKYAASKLYGAARRQAVALGYRQIVTYTLKGEPGTSLTAAGFTAEHLVRGKTWHTPSRPRVDKHPTLPKVRWAGL